jgi:3-isopropylmalate dehydrogenase
MNRIVGIIEGEGIGREIVAATLRCLGAVQQVRGARMEFRHFTKDIKRDTAGHGLTTFYREVRDAGGVILRASVPAPLCYRLRRDFDLFYKLIAFQPDSSTGTFSPLKPEWLRGVNLLLMRHNNQGLYHGYFESQGGRIRCEQYYDEASIRRLAEVAFRQAVSRRRRLDLLIKDEVLGSLGILWRKAFKEVAYQYSDVRFDVAPPDSGSAEILLAPWKFDVVVAGDVEGDMLSDQLAALIYGTRAVTPSVNCDDRGFATYQTIHGTAKGLTGKDIANPAGMILAAAWMLERSFGWRTETKWLQAAVFDVLRQTLRSVSNDKHNADLVLDSIGTEHFAELVSNRFLSYGARDAA